MLTVSLESEVQRARSHLGQLYRGHPIVLGDFDRLVAHLHEEWGKLDVPFLLCVIEFAALKHAGQMRNHADWVPYFIHPLRVALVLWEEGGVRETCILAAALLHDTLEDTQTSPDEIEHLCGGSILSYVQELTERPGYKGVHSHEAKTIRLADRTHNLQDLLDHPPQIWKSEKVEVFLQKSKDLLAALQGTHSQLEEVYANAMQKLARFNQS